MSNASDDVAPVKGERSTPGSGRNRTGHRDERRAVLVQAAVRAIRRHGPDVAMEDIATEAGGSKPILYRHFHDKGDLYMAVSETATACTPGSAWCRRPGTGGCSAVPC